ncbi:MAG: dihydroorotate dehydrogenase electron transfer subunit [Clostridia bacterium]|nr:dihydroorotate dehydrogenase electron transfer subunit [Clostridia bacterium]
MKDTVFTLLSNKEIAKNTYEWVLSGDTKGIREGQFVNIKLDGFYLRRPISVCDCDGDKLTLIFKVVGDGTAKMAEAAAGEKFLVLTGLGNGYNLSKSGHAPLLIGGGAGVPPMYLAARKLCARGITPTVILGFNTLSEVFYKEQFEALGCKVLITTADGSCGIKGFVTDAMAGLEYSYFYTCGPLPMLKAVYNASATDGEFSFEERMGCGFGACMGCTCETKYGYKRICRDGPVLSKEEIVW